MTITVTPVMLKIMETEFSEGASIVEVCAEINISRETFYDWIDPESPRYKEDFSYTVKKGIEQSEAWWQRKGRKGLNDPSLSYTGWYMNMKNRFGWADKQESRITDKDGNDREVQQTVVVLPSKE
jgi:hypothetical protein